MIFTPAGAPELDDSPIVVSLMEMVRKMRNKIHVMEGRLRLEKEKV